MRRSNILTVGCLLGLFFVLGLLMARWPTSGQVAANPAANLGRYQMSVVSGGGLCVDTTNGHCWSMSDVNSKDWIDLGISCEPG